MKKVTDNEIIDNLNKWKSICVLMGKKRDIIIVDHIIKEMSKSNNEKIENKEGNNNVTSIDKLKHILDAINKRDESILTQYKLVLIKLDINIEEEWGKLSESKKLKLSKLELNVIYYMLYKPSKVTYINKSKSEIIKDINYFVKDEKRNKSLEESNLV